jgi:hypothetical protein
MEREREEKRGGEGKGREENLAQDKPLALKSRISGRGGI